jgi:hypothetical protein
MKLWIELCVALPVLIVVVIAVVFRMLRRSRARRGTAPR